MSGIVGMYRFDGQPVREQDVHRMLATMPHRGVDGTGVWCDGSIGLGHAMLHTTPEAVHEQLPVQDAEGRWALTADARIDNREDLARALGMRLSEQVSDSALILAAYERWGTAGVEHLVGDFAFALWDARERQLVLVCDHLGVRQLYYVHVPGCFVAFASEIKALLVLEGVSGELDEEAIAEFFVPELLSADRTIYRQVRRALPAHIIRVGDSTVEQRRYWKLEAAPAQPRRSDEAYIEEFRSLFQEAVRCRLRSVGPVGAELSGGLDSSYVTCVAHNLLHSAHRLPLHTFSTVYDIVQESDERPFIHEVTGRFESIEAHYCPVDARGITELLDEIFAVVDDGRVAGNHYLNWITAQAAGQQGVRVLLTGQDGDSTVSHGLELFYELARAGAWERFAHEATRHVEWLRSEREAYAKQQSVDITPRSILEMFAVEYVRDWAAEGHYLKLAQAIQGMHRHFGLSRRRVLRRLRPDLLSPRWTRQVIIDRQAVQEEIPVFLNPGLVRSMQIIERLIEKKRREKEEKRAITVRGKQAANFATPYVVYTLGTLAQYGAVHGVEVRHPFMDKRLIEFCVSLPADLSLRDGWTRWIMRRAMEGIVPTRIVQRVGKVNLEPQHRFLMKAVERQVVRQQIEQTEDQLGSVLDLAYVEAQASNLDRLGSKELPNWGKAMSLTQWGARSKHMPVSEPDV